MRNISKPFLRRVKRRPTPQRRVLLHRRLGVERLEARMLLATISVNWTAADYGADDGWWPAEFESSAWKGPDAAVVAEYQGLSGGDASPLAAAVAGSFLEQHGAMFVLDEPDGELLPYSTAGDALGMTHLRYHQSHNGVPVFGGEVLVHLDPATRVDSANGRVVSQLDVDTTARLTPEEAVARAKQFYGREFATAEPDVSRTKLYIFNKGLIQNTDDPVSYLVWEVHLSDVQAMTSESFYVDAHSGELVYSLTGTRGLTRKIYDCSYDRTPGCYLDFRSVGHNYTFGRSEGQPPRGPNPIPAYAGTTDVDDLYDLVGHRWGRWGQAVNSE